MADLGSDRDRAVAGAPSDNRTMVGILDRLSGAGYSGDFRVSSAGTLVCGSCRHEMDASAAELDQLCRLEGASDPADMAAVLALTCPSCGAKGTCVVKYGPDAEPEEVEVLLAVDDKRPR
jgi:hypothetical protein